MYQVLKVSANQSTVRDAPKGIQKDIDMSRCIGELQKFGLTGIRCPAVDRTPYKLGSQLQGVAQLNTLHVQNGHYAGCAIIWLQLQ